MEAVSYSNTGALADMSCVCDSARTGVARAGANVIGTAMAVNAAVASNNFPLKFNVVHRPCIGILRSEDQVNGTGAGVVGMATEAQRGIQHRIPPVARVKITTYNHRSSAPFFRALVV